MTRERLVRRIETEARAYVNAKGSSRDAMILGRVYGLLEAGVLEGYWRKRDADSAGELVANRYRVSSVSPGDRLSEALGDGVTLRRAVTCEPCVCGPIGGAFARYSWTKPLAAIRRHE